MFRALEVDDWRQFDNVVVEFHPRLTILTGANATGKSTLLGILARHFNWSRSYSSSPMRVRGAAGQWINVGRRRARKILRESDWEQVGRLMYENGATDIMVPGRSSPSRTNYDLYMPNQQVVFGAFLTSHRYVSGNYAQVATIPVAATTPEQSFETFTNELRTRWQGGWTGRSPQLALKEALISSAVFSNPNNEYVEYSPESSSVWLGFRDILRQVMPKALGFNQLQVRGADVFVESKSGDFLLDDASGGLSSIIEISWQIFLRSRTTPQFTLLLDEPENHLHPSLQRDLIPDLLKAFPSVQFIIASHSPFVVTATPDSNVYVLDYNEQNRVEARRLDHVNKAASADETLRKALGMESTAPSWATNRYEEILNRHMTGSITPEQLRALRSELRAHGLESEFAHAVVAIDELREQQAE